MPHPASPGSAASRSSSRGGPGQGHPWKAPKICSVSCQTGPQDAARFEQRLVDKLVPFCAFAWPKESRSQSARSSDSALSAQVRRPAAATPETANLHAQLLNALWPRKASSRTVIPSSASAAACRARSSRSRPLRRSHRFVRPASRRATCSSSPGSRARSPRRQRVARRRRPGPATRRQPGPGTRRLPGCCPLACPDARPARQRRGMAGRLVLVGDLVHAGTPSTWHTLAADPPRPAA